VGADWANAFTAAREKGNQRANTERRMTKVYRGINALAV
jgi:hypothetical protein